MLLRANVIYLVREQRASLWQLAVFAAIVRSLPHLFADCGRNLQAYPLAFRDTRAFACIRSRN